MENAYHYSFKPGDYEKSPQKVYERMRRFARDTHALIDLIQQSPQRSVPIIAPIFDRTINLTFAEPLSPSVLEQVAARGYICKDTSPQGQYVSDKAAE